jgi:hypothetical protein
LQQACHQNIKQHTTKNEQNTDASAISVQLFIYNFSYTTFHIQDF